jgi:Interferon-induced transmembrane protein
MAQPSVWGGQPSTLHKPNNYLVWSILATLFCCLPLGIAAIVNAAKVDGLWHSGDYYGAQRAAAQAKKWCAWSVGIGLVLIVLYFVAEVMGSSAEPTFTQY